MGGKRQGVVLSAGPGGEAQLDVGDSHGWAIGPGGAGKRGLRNIQRQRNGLGGWIVIVTRRQPGGGAGRQLADEQPAVGGQADVDSDASAATVAVVLPLSYRPDAKAGPARTFGRRGVESAQTHAHLEVAAVAELSSQQMYVAVRAASDAFETARGYAPVLQAVRPVLRADPNPLCVLEPGAAKLGAGLAITVAFGYSAAVVLGVDGKTFFWELATLIDDMVLNILAGP